MLVRAGIVSSKFALPGMLLCTSRGEGIGKVTPDPRLVRIEYNVTPSFLGT